MTPAEFFERRERTAAALLARKLDALLVTSLPNVRYLTGFTGSNALLLLWPGGEVLLTDPRYAIQAAQETGCKVRVVRSVFYPAIGALAARRRLRRIGFEAARLSCDVYENLRVALPLGAALEPAAGIVEAQRMIKSAGEIALIRRSVETCSNAFQAAIGKAKPGMLETELAAEIDYQMRRMGAQKPAFDTIVASGARSALPHAQPAANAFRTNQLLLVDMGASQDGYASDMTRMAFLGRPGRKVTRLYRAVLEAQLAALDAVRPGVPVGQVDRAARRVLRSRGLERQFVHSTGHGLGLEIHEPPRLGKREKIRLAAGMVVTIEPGAYLEGFGGVRIEDTVAVTPSGCEVLTSVSKELLVI